MKATVPPRTKFQHAGPKQLIAVYWYHLKEFSFADSITLGQAQLHTISERIQPVLGHFKTMIFRNSATFRSPSGRPIIIIPNSTSSLLMKALDTVDASMAIQAFVV